MPGIPTNISAHIGKTPMLQLTRMLPADSGAELFVKLESFNPAAASKTGSAPR